MTDKLKGTTQNIVESSKSVVSKTMNLSPKDIGKRFLII